MSTVHGAPTTAPAEAEPEGLAGSPASASPSTLEEPLPAVRVRAAQLERLALGEAVDELDPMAALALVLLIDCPWSLEVERAGEEPTRFAAAEDLAIEARADGDDITLTGLPRDALSARILALLTPAEAEPETEPGTERPGATAAVEVPDVFATLLLHPEEADSEAIGKRLDEVPEAMLQAMAAIDELIVMRRVSPGAALAYAEAAVVDAGDHGLWLLLRELDRSAPASTGRNTLQRLTPSRLRRTLGRLVDDLDDPAADARPVTIESPLSEPGGEELPVADGPSSAAPARP